MAKDLVNPEDFLDASEFSNTSRVFQSENLDELLDKFAEIMNKELLREDGGVIPVADIDLNEKNLLAVDELVGADSTQEQVWRLKYDEAVNQLLMQQNTNTDDNPIWETRHSFELQQLGNIAVTENKYEVWHEDNDGPQSGLVSDTLRGFTPQQLLGSTSGIMTGFRTISIEANLGQKKFTMNNFDPENEQQLVTSGGLVMDQGLNGDYVRNDQQANITGSNQNDGTYTIRTPEVNYDAGNDQTSFPVLQKIPDESDETGNFEINSNTFSIEKIDNGEVFVSGDQTSIPEDSEIEFNLERAGTEKIIIHILEFKTPGEGEGLNADKVDGKHANEIRSINPVDPILIYSGTGKNINTTVNISGDIPSEAEAIAVKTYTEGAYFVPESGIGQVRVSVSKATENPSGSNEHVGASYGTKGGDLFVPIRGNHADASMSTVVLGKDEREVRIKREDASTFGFGAIEDLQTNVWILGYI